jgi:hypothetical protein
MTPFLAGTIATDDIGRVVVVSIIITALRFFARRGHGFLQGLL